MESHSLPMRIHCSDRAQQVLNEQAPEIQLESRGEIPIKGKGTMTTFFVLQEKSTAASEPSVLEAAVVDAEGVPSSAPQAVQ